MKRLLRAALPLLVMLACVGTANAQSGYRWVYENVPFRNACLACTDGYLQPDSANASGNAARRDTTVAIYEDRWAMPMMLSTAIIDSTPLFKVDIYPNANFKASGTTTNLSISADSIYLTTQVSNDGVNWLTPATYHIAFQAANTVNTSEIGAFLLEQGTSNTFSVGFHQVRTLNAFSSANLFGQGASTAPTDKQLWGYRYMRFILGWGGTGTGAYAVSVAHLEPIFPAN